MPDITPTDAIPNIKPPNLHKEIERLWSEIIKRNNAIHMVIEALKEKSATDPAARICIHVLKEATK